MSTVSMSVFQSRWGWHAADYPTFLEVKEYHRLLLRDLRATKRHDRWSAKLPGNRKGPEPNAVGTDPKTYRWVLDEYRKLRRPVVGPEGVDPLDLPVGWRNHHAMLTEFYSD